MKRHRKASTAGSTKRQAKSLGRFFRGASGLLALALTAICLFGVSSALAAPPTVTIESASEVGFTNAKVKGNVDPADHNTGYHFDYATQAQWEAEGNSFANAPQAGNNGLAENAGPTPVQATLEGLSPNTTYHLRLYAENDQGEHEEAIAATFTTQTTTAPALVVKAPEPSYLKAQLAATINPEGGNVNPIGPTAVPISWQLQFANVSEPGNWQLAEAGTIEGAQAESNSPIEVKGVAGEIYAPLLSPQTTYITRLVVNYASTEEIATEEPEFETLAVAKPTIEELEVTEAGPHSATFSAKVNPNSPEPKGSTSEAEKEAFKTFWHFECTPECPGLSGGEVQADNSPNEVTEQATGLIPSTPYEVRLIASNAGGEEAAGPQPFGTEAGLPSIDSSSSSDITTSEAILHAQINPEGAATTYHFQYVDAEHFEAEGGFASPHTITTSESSPIGSDATDHPALAAIGELQHATTYHYRVLATNSVGTTPGPGQTFTTYVQEAPDTNCPNQAFRYGPGANLPDCRAYEMVSPIDKNGGDIRTPFGYGFFAGTFFRAEITQASLNGEKFTFSSYKAFAGASSGPYSNQYIASRGADGWSTEPISPPVTLDETRGSFLSPLGIDVQFKGFTEDLSRAWVTNANRFPLTPDASKDDRPNLYTRDNGNGNLQALTIGEVLSGFGQRIEFSGYSKDGSHAVFSDDAALTPEAASKKKLFTGDIAPIVYDYTGGELHVVSKLPDGELDQGFSGVGSGGLEGGYPGAYHGYRQLEHAISDDGSRIFWNSDGKIYVRIDNQTTVPVSEGGAWFWTATPSGSKALFSEGGLYEFNVDTETRRLIAHEIIGVLGASEDLSRIYFVSKEALAPGASAGERNLYLDHEGTMTLVATLAPFDTAEGGAPSTIFLRSNIVDPYPINRGSRVSADGRHIAFISSASLTGYDNTDALNGRADIEVYTYDADTNELTCASCNPSGARPVGKALALPYEASGRPFSFAEAGGDYWAAAWLPTWENSLHASRLLSADGKRVFFNSFDALVPRDTNGKQDVYQWEAQGSGTCREAGGCVSLISTGQSVANSEFMDATPSGGDVFIRTEESIDPRDPSGMDVYDAHAGGGYPPPPPPPTPCIGDSCQSIPAAPNDPTPASAGFHGAGNATPRKAHRRCSARARHAKKHKRAKRCKRSSRRAGR